MINFKNTKTGLDIEYTKGDTFSFNIECEDEIPEGSTMRLQISPNGNVNNIILYKNFNTNNNMFSVTLTQDETELLNIDEVYQYRFTFIDIYGNIITNISGNLIVKWGA